MTLSFRTARSDDVEGILHIQRRAFLEIGSAFYGEALMREAMEAVTLFTPDLIDEGHYFVAEAEGKLIATGGWSQSLPAYAAAMGGGAAANGTTAIVRSVYVCPDHARKGVGRRMMEYLEQDARLAGITRLTMTATLPGVPLYRRMGYRESGRDPAVLPSGNVVELIGMERELTKCDLAA